MGTSYFYHSPYVFKIGVDEVAGVKPLSDEISVTEFRVFLQKIAMAPSTVYNCALLQSGVFKQKTASLKVKRFDKIYLILIVQIRLFNSLKNYCF